MDEQQNMQPVTKDTTKAWIAYLVGWITGLIFLLTEKNDPFVRFHAAQSICLSVIAMVLSWIPVIGWFVWIAFFVLWIICMVKASQGEKYMLPILGEFAEKNVMDWIKPG